MKTLGQILGWVQTAVAKAKRILAETLGMWKKDHAFLEIEKKYRSLEEGGQHYPDKEQYKPMVTTVPERCRWDARAQAERIDAELTREATNQKASAELMINGKAYRIPATGLLALERRLKELRATYQPIPTLDANINWTHEPETNTWRAPTETTYHEVGRSSHKQFDDPHGKHPFQIVEVEDRIRIGEITTHRRSGCISSSQKAALLDRVDRLYADVLLALEEAKRCEAVEMKLGTDLFEYLFDGIF